MGNRADTEDADEVGSLLILSLLSCIVITAYALWSQRSRASMDANSNMENALGGTKCYELLQTLIICLKSTATEQRTQILTRSSLLHHHTTPKHKVARKSHERYMT